MAEIEFSISSDPEHTWAAWGNTNYTTIADVIGELIDNSLQSGATECRVRIFKEGEQRILIIEDNGKWGKIDQNTLTKCFGYGKDSTVVKSGLNEHNCGLKQVLANTDPENKNWLIQIKQKDVVREIRAPYKTRMSFKVAKSYDGTLGSENATLIRTVISDTQLKTLYMTERKNKPNDELLIGRLKLYLASMWMMNDRVTSKKFNIFVNNDYIQPYTLDDKDGVDKKGDRKMPIVPKALSDKTRQVGIEVWKYHLDKGFTHDHPLFRRHPANAGVYIFKHGRLVKGAIFSEIYTSQLRDYAYGGHLVLVNITGNTEDLPATQTTKSDFNARDEKLATLYDHIKSVAPAVSMKESEIINHTEGQLMDKLFKMKEAVHRKAISAGTYELKQEKQLKLTINGEAVTSKEKIDLLEWDTVNKTVSIIEGKIDVINSQNLRQLFFYYRNLKYFCALFDGYTIDSRFITQNDTETSEYKNELLMLQELDPEFNPEIELFADYGI